LGLCDSRCQLCQNNAASGKEKEQLSIINDQHGAPTGAELLADCTAIAIRAAIQDTTLYGTYHLVASGETTWYEYAQHVFALARQKGESLIIKDVSGVPHLLTQLLRNVR
jgi:dTDP-4-dehydrorhamnose reductase